MKEKKETISKESECPLCSKKIVYKFPKTKKIKYFHVQCVFCGFGYVCLNGELNVVEK